MSESQAPTPVSKSQGGPYIAAIVVLILLILGLVWFRFSKKSAPPPTAPVIQTVSAVATPPPPMLNIPAPPEMDAGDEAGTEDAGKKKHVKVGKSLCAGTCSGSASPALRSALRAAGGAARGCYERALRTNEMLQGRIVVAVRVASNGRVCSAAIASDSVGSSQVSSCVIGIFRGRKFPGATGGRCVDVQVPLNFTPKGKK